MLRSALIRILILVFVVPVFAQDFPDIRISNRMYNDIYRAEVAINEFLSVDLETTEEALELVRATRSKLNPSQGYISHPSHTAEFDRLKKKFTSAFVRRFVDRSDNFNQLVSTLETLIAVGFKHLTAPGVTELNYFGTIYGRSWPPWAPSFLSYFYVTKTNANGDLIFEFSVSPGFPASENHQFNNMVMQLSGSQKDLLLALARENSSIDRSWITRADPTKPVEELLCELALK